MGLFTEYVNHPVVEEIKTLDINTLSPMQAFELLRAMRGKVAQSEAKPTKVRES